jgi:hypothetical protein
MVVVVLVVVVVVVIVVVVVVVLVVVVVVGVVVVAGLSSEGPGSHSDQSMWGLCWTKWHWDRFFTELLDVIILFHSTAAQYSYIPIYTCGG